MKMKDKIFKYIVIIMVMFIGLYPSTTFAKGKMPKGSEIGSINVQEKTDAEIMTTLETEIALWKKDDATIDLVSDYEQYQIPRSALEFHIEESIQTLRERTKRTLTSLFMRQKNVSVPLEVTINEADSALRDLKEKSYINYDAILTQLEAQASELAEGNILLEYLDESAIPLETIAEVKIDLPMYSNAVMTYALEQLEEVVIAKDEQFSLLDTVQFPEKLTTSNKELSIIGTALYELFLHSNFMIVERHQHLRLPTYAEAGTDVQINRQKEDDLIVVNKNDRSMRLEVTREEEDVLLAKLLAAPADTTYELDVETIKNVKERTVYRYSKELLPGDEVIIDAGAKGLQVAIHREKLEKGMFVESEKISEDLYLPEAKVIIKSTREAEEIPEEDIVSESDVTELLDQEAEKLEEMSDEIENDLAFIEEIVEESPSETGSDNYYHPNAPTISAELERLKKMQLALEEQFKTIDKLFEAFYREMHAQYDAEVSEKFKEIDEQLEALTEQLLNNENGGSDK